MKTQWSAVKTKVGKTVMRSMLAEVRAGAEKVYGYIEGLERGYFRRGDKVWSYQHGADGAGYQVRHITERTAREAYRVTVGEVGNEIGHRSTHYCASNAGAVRAARRACASYGGDGWWIVTGASGREVAHGGRRVL